MKNKTQGYNLDYPELTARRYGPVIHNNGNLTLVDPVESFLAEAFITRESQLKIAVEDFAEEDGELIILDPDKEYTLKVKNDDETLEKKKGKLDEFTSDELAFGLEEKLRDKGEHKLWWGSENRVVAKKIILSEEVPRLDAHSGGIVLSGRVASKKSKWFDVDIYGPFTKSKEALQNVECSCPDSRYIRKKLGYTHLSHLGFHGSTFLRFAKQYPHRIPSFREQERKMGSLEFFVPFITDSRDRMVETLIANYMANMSRPESAKKLLERKEIYHKKLLRMLQNGKADYQVLPNKDFTNVYSGEVLGFYRNIKQTLEDKKFNFKWYVYEKKGTQYEVVAMDFERDESNSKKYFVRVITKGGPPLIIRRVIEGGEKEIFSNDAPENINPWQELYLPKENRDDRTRVKTSYEVRLPIQEGVRIPVSIYGDYRTALKHYFKGKEGELQRRLYAGVAKDRLNKKHREKVYKMLTKR